MLKAGVKSWLHAPQKFVSRLLILIGLLHLVLLATSNSLLLWPLNHSCAKPHNLTSATYTLTETAEQSGEFASVDDAIQANLIDASPELPFTLAQANAYNINLDELASCYEYPLELASNSSDQVIDTERLEPCKFGLVYEKAHDTLSAVSHFNLACSRQWLKPLLWQTFALGLLLGLLLNCERLLAKKKAPEEVDKWAEPEVEEVARLARLRAALLEGKLASWMLVELVCVGVLQFSGARLNANHSEASYAHLLAISLTRALLLSGALTRLLRYGKLEGSRHTFTALVALNLTFNAICGPLAVRLFAHWLRLNDSLSLLSVIYALATSLFELQLNCQPFGALFSFKAGAWFRRLATTEQRASQEDSADFQRALELMSARGRDWADEKGAQRADGDVVKTRNSPPAKVCEFCLTSEQTVYAMMNHAPPNNSEPTAHDDLTPTVARRDAYQPTTRALASCSLSGADLVTGRTLHFSGQPSEAHTESFWSTTSARGSALHLNLLPVEARLIGAANLAKVALLAFCVAFNYFLFQMLPNHELIHNESLVSKLARKAAFEQLNGDVRIASPQWQKTDEVPATLNRTLNSTQLGRLRTRRNTTEADDKHSTHLAPNAINDLRMPVNSSQTTTAMSSALETKARSDHNHNNTPEANGNAMRHNPYDKGARLNDSSSLLSASQSDSARQSKAKHLFDYSSKNSASLFAEALKNSKNPLKVAWITAQLNSWPIELLALLLHKHIEPIYFRLGRLFTLVNMGSRLLLTEWSLIGLIRRQNHLIEIAWLQICALLVSRFTATLILYNFFHTMLKLSHRLSLRDLFPYTSMAISVIVALSLASLAPILEKLDLVLIPLALIANNCLAYFISDHLLKDFKQSLCPMMFEEEGGPM